MKITLIDFDDSFTWNIVAELEKVEFTVEVKNYLNFKSIEDFETLYSHPVLLGPGFGNPKDYPLWSEFAAAKRCKGTGLFGICLGHQLIALSYGASIRAKPVPWHGIATTVHLPEWLKSKQGAQDSVQVQWYNSWEVTSESLAIAAGKDQLKRWDTDGCLIALEYPSGLSFQFHPESIGTSCPELFFHKIREKLYNNRDE